MAIRDEDALNYHEFPRAGKTEVVSTKPCLTQMDLSLAYTPGVAVPCLHIEKNPEDAYRYTNKGNLVAVISNGTAVLGLGDIGALAGKPVMEGKGVLFKRFAHVDVFDIEVNTHDPEEVIKFCQLIEPTLGGINLEDIKAPECFEIEERLKATMKIPVFHDDQHGTAIISGAALVNACELAGKDISKVKVVVSGAGASAIACAKLYEVLGVSHDNIILVDTKGVVYKGRKEGMNKYKEYFAQDTKLRTLEEAMKGIDVFLGCSAKGLVTQQMVKSMAKNPIVFAMANPDPEIPYPDAKEARSDVIMATGRSDYPNQVNNVLGFPFIFRGALDVRATAINEQMKLAASKALAALAKEPVPDSVGAAYGGAKFEFGREYIIPKPFDPRVLVWEASAVAKAACDSGVAQKPITDWDGYRAHLEGMTAKSGQVMRTILSRAKKEKKVVVFPEGESTKMIEACRILVEEGLCQPLLLGDEKVITEKAAHHGLDISKVKIINPVTSKDRDQYAEELYKLRCRMGMTRRKAHYAVRNPIEHGLMLLRAGKANGMVAGIYDPYPDTIRKILPLTELKGGVRKAIGVHVILVGRKVFFFADTTINIDPNTELLVEIALRAADVAKFFNIEPKIAMLSFSNFGDNNNPLARKVHDAVTTLSKTHPELIVDGEMHGNVAVNPALCKENFPLSKIQGDANVLIFPNLDASNIGYKLVTEIADGESIGPLLVGLKYPINIVSVNSDIRDIVNMAALSSHDAI
jgi:malate dehydrogenase (oxaloacetate-decarboxylating)(NADP+)